MEDERKRSRPKKYIYVTLRKRTCLKDMVGIATVSSLLISKTSLHTLPLSHIKNCSFAPFYPPLPESMILLGSIERAQLQSLLSQQLSCARRLQCIKERGAEEKKILSTESNPPSNNNSSLQTGQEEGHIQVRGHRRTHAL